MVHAETVINPSASTGPRPHQYVIDTSFGAPSLARDQALLKRSNPET
jgi:hypothetical protein